MKYTYYFYEIKNVLTGAQFQIVAPNFSSACQLLGQKPHHCRCIWKADPENAGDPANY
jgi:hypothetical protein